MLPKQDDEHIQTVPSLSQVSILPVQPHRNYFDDHLNSKKREDAVIKHLQRLTPCRLALLKISTL